MLPQNDLCRKEASSRQGPLPASREDACGGRLDAGAAGSVTGKLAVLAGLAVLATGVLVLAGWLLDIPSLKSVLPGFVTMKANAAIGLVLAGVSLALLGRGGRSARTGRVSQACAGIIALLGLLTLCQYLFAWDLSIDQLLFREPAGTVGTLSPGRMAPATAADFLLLGIALLLTGSSRTIPTSQRLAVLAGLIGLLALAGVLYGAPNLYGVGRYSQMAVHTSAAFVILSLGMLLARPAEGLMRTVTRDTMGRWLLRRLAPLAVAVPLVLGWLRVEGEQHGYFEGAFGVALMMMVLIVVLVSMIWWTSRALTRIDTVRRQAEEGLRKSQADLQQTEGRYRTLVENIRLGVTLIGRDYRVLVTNAAQGEFFNRPPASFVGKPCFAEFEKRDQVCSHCPGSKALATGLPAEAETEGVRDDGTRFFVHIHAFPILGPDGRAEAFIEVIEDITDRKRAREAVLQSEARFRVLYESSRDAMMIVEPPLWKFTSGNPTTLTMFGAKDENEFTSHGPGDLSPPRQPNGGESVAMAKQMIETAIREGSCFFEWTHKRLGGEEFPATVLLTRMEYAGNVVLQATVRDITEQKQAEKGLREANEFNQQVIHSAREGIIVYGRDLRLKMWNPYMEQLTGLPAKDVLGRDPLEVFPFLSEAGFVQRLEKILAGEASESVEFPYQIAQTGRAGWASDVSAPLRNAAGGIVGIIGTVRDITDRKQAEEERREALRRQEGITLLQQSLLAPVPLEDSLKAVTDGVVRIFGADFCRVWIIRPGDLCARGCMHAQASEGPHVCRYRDRCLQLLASSGRYTHTDGKAHRRVPFGCYKIGRVASDEEHKFLTNDVIRDPRVHNHDWARELGLVSFAGYQLRVPGGETLGVLAVFAKHPIFAEEDSLLDGLSSALALVVQRAASEHAVRQAKTEAEQANAAKTTFLANMSHEIRTPMTAILGFTDMLGRSIEGCVTCPTRAQNKQSVQVIRRNGEHLLTLINDILDLSKIEAGKMLVERASCSPVQIVEETVSLMRVGAVQKGLTLGARYEFPLPETILTDPARVRQILMNLVGNAVKFTSHGGVEIAVRCTADVPQGRASVAFDVKDTGIGIAPEQVGGLFRPFAQADPSTTRQFGGTGLGLAISKRLAEALGGDIRVVSRPGEGSSFTFTLEAQLPLPVRMLDDPFDVAERPGRQLQPGGPAAVRLAGRALLAEDGPDNQTLISMILTQAGAEVELAANGRLAVEKALAALSAAAPYDVILMDMQMPEMDGYQATANLRRGGYKGPIVALTAHAMAGDRQKCLDAGCDDYAAKPVDRAALLATLARLMAAAGRQPVPAEAPKVVAPAGDAIRSEFADEADMADLIDQFVANLPGRLIAMAEALAGNSRENLHRLAHQLKGAGGGYGYPLLTDQARKLEDAAKAGDMEAAGLALNELRTSIRAVLAGRRTDPAPNNAKV